MSKKPLHEIAKQILLDNYITLSKGMYCTYEDLKELDIIKSPTYFKKDIEILDLGEGRITYAGETGYLLKELKNEDLWCNDKLFPPRKILENMFKKKSNFIDKYLESEQDKEFKALHEKFKKYGFSGFSDKDYEEFKDKMYTFSFYDNPKRFSTAEWKHIKEIKIGEKELGELEDYRSKIIEKYTSEDFNKIFDILRQYPGVEFPLGILVSMAGLEINLPGKFGRVLGKSLPKDIERKMPETGVKNFRYWAEPTKNK